MDGSSPSDLGTWHSGGWRLLNRLHTRVQLDPIGMISLLYLYTQVILQTMYLYCFLSSAT